MTTLRIAVMCRSTRSFTTRVTGNPQAFDCRLCPGVGNLSLAWLYDLNSWRPMSRKSLAVIFPFTKKLTIKSNTWVGQLNSVFASWSGNLNKPSQRFKCPGVTWRGTASNCPTPCPTHYDYLKNSSPGSLLSQRWEDGWLFSIHQRCDGSPENPFQIPLQMFDFQW